MNIKKVITTSFQNETWVLMGLFLVSAVLRLFQINVQSLWLDEIYTMNMADPANSWKQIYELSTVNDPLSVLYFVFLNVWFKLFGYSALAARLVSVLFGILSVYWIFRLGKALFDGRTALFAALLLTISPFHIEYSQEARVYSFYMFATLFAFYRLLLFIKTPSSKSAVWYGFSALLMVLCHFFGFFVLASQMVIFIFFAIRFQHVKMRQYLVLAGISALTFTIGYLPIIPIFIWLTKAKGTWIDPPKYDALVKLFVDFNGGSLWLSSISAIFFAFAVFSFILPKDSVNDKLLWKRSDSLIFVLLWMLVSFAVPFLLSIFHFPIFHKRYMISILPTFLLIEAVGFELLSKSWIKFISSVAVLIISGFVLFGSNGFYAHRHKSDFRAVSDFVLQNNSPKYTVYTSLPYHFDYFYRSEGECSLIQSGNLNDLIASFRTAQAPLKAFWFTDAHGRSFGLNTENQQFLDSNFILQTQIDALDAWARLYLPREMPSQSTLVKLDRTNFFPDCASCQPTTFALFSNGSIESKKIGLQKGSYKLVIRAMSSPIHPINGSTAHLKVLFGNNPVGDYFLSRFSFISGDTLELLVPQADSSSFKLQFDNDTCVDKWDRNLLMRDLQVFH